jgi:hypothetical protein
MLGEPMRDARHVLLEVARGRDVEPPGTTGRRSAVLPLSFIVAPWLGGQASDIDARRDLGFARE